MKRPIVIRPAAASYQVRIIGARPTPLRDFYHLLIRCRWPTTFAVLAGAYLTANAVFAVAYLITGGVAETRSGSFADAFFFSVQTMGTIGYGASHPVSAAANLVVVGESIVGLIMTALATGLVFAKFSRPTARVVFTREAVISPVDGQPNLSLRIGNERGNRIVDAQLRVGLLRTEQTREGVTFYRIHDLPLVRDRAQSLTRSLTLRHVIDQASPLFGADLERLVADEVELQVQIVGLDDTTMQPIHASHRYYPDQIRFGHRHADIISDGPDGAMIVDLRRFHDLVAVEPAAAEPA